MTNIHRLSEIELDQQHERILAALSVVDNLRPHDIEFFLSAWAERLQENNTLGPFAIGEVLKRAGDDVAALVSRLVVRRSI